MFDCRNIRNTNCIFCAINILTEKLKKLRAPKKNDVEKILYKSDSIWFVDLVVRYSWFNLINKKIGIYWSFAHFYFENISMLWFKFYSH